MGLIAVGWPSSEPESAAMVCLLQANEIPCFVHGAGLASILPSMQIASYSAPTIMVPESAAAEATELLSVFTAPTMAVAMPRSVGILAKLRMILVVLLFGRSIYQPTADDSEESKDGG